MLAQRSNAEQIDAIERATTVALKSKESALQFLKDAGVLQILKPSFHTSRVPIKQKKEEIEFVSPTYSSCRIP